MTVALDTNILIYLLEGIEPYATKVESILNSFMKEEKQGIISTINVAEILTGFYTTKDEEKATETKNLLQDLTQGNFKIVPVTFKIADLAAKLRAEKGGRLPDAIIAATAIDQKADILYSQDKDLQRYSQYINVSKLSSKKIKS